MINQSNQKNFITTNHIHKKNNLNRVDLPKNMKPFSRKHCPVWIISSLDLQWGGGKKCNSKNLRIKRDMGQ